MPCKVAEQNKCTGETYKETVLNSRSSLRKQASTNDHLCELLSKDSQGKM